MHSLRAAQWLRALEKAETEVVVPVARDVVYLDRRPAVPGIVAPAAAPLDTVGPIPALPCTAIGWRAFVVVVPLVLHPFLNIAVHVVQPPGIRQLQPDRVGLAV